jgi:predicted MFS family arabinose efflux permease
MTESPTSTRTPQRRTAVLVFAATLALVLSLSGSALKSTVQVYFAMIANGLHAGLGTFAWSTTTFAIVIAVASPLVGALADRFGGSAVLVTGTVLAGGTFLFCAAVPDVLLFAPVYGIIGALSFTMLSYVPLGKLADELFAGRGEGLAYAVMTNGPAVGFMVLVPVWVWLGTLVSWRVVFVGAGVAMLVVLTPLALMIRRLAAEDTGAGPAGPPDVPLTARERLVLAVGNRSFMILAVAFGACGVTMAFIDVHMVADLEMAGMHPVVVSGSLSLLGAFEIAGSLVAGRMCDRGLIKQTLVAGYALRGTAMLLLALTPTAATAMVFGALFGLSYMVTVVATTLWIARVVPAGARATAMGLTWTLHAVGAAASSQLGAYAAQRFHSYTQVSLVEAAAVFVSLVLVARLRLAGAGPAARFTVDIPAEPDTPSTVDAPVALAARTPEPGAEHQ